VVGQADQGRGPSAIPRPAVVEALGQTVKFLVLLLLIVAALASTTVLDRASHVLLLKVFLVAFLSLPPGWLYLQFIRVKGIGLYDEYVLNLYRLKIDDIVNLPKPPPGSRYWQQCRRPARTRESIPHSTST
jgi:hypothetical protein